MPLNALTDDIRRGADHAHVWINVILGYCFAVAITQERTWWGDPIFSVARMIPHSQAIWGASLAVFTTVYVVGSFMREGHKHRGITIIVGASLCFLWYFAFCLCLVRFTYVNPERSATLWPLMVFVLGLLYAHRVVLYLDVFTGRRWSMDPFQMYALTFLMLLSVTEVVIGVSPASVQAQFDRGTAVSLAVANFVGAACAMVGLHLRDLEMGLWIELWGYASLTATMLLYVLSELNPQGKISVPIATLGFALSEAFVFASLHRAVQIGVYKYAQFHGHRLSAKLAGALSNEPSVRKRRLLMGDPTSPYLDPAEEPRTIIAPIDTSGETGG